MKSALEASFLACIMALAAGCSSADGSAEAQAPSPEATPTDTETAPLSQSLVAPSRPPASINPCAAVLCAAPSTCEVVDGQAVCTPIDEPPPASGQFCGGIAGIACPGSGSCVDNPSDGCDPDRGGADCGGICECNIRALCIQGFAFDAAPGVCACVPVEPEVDACAAVRCREGRHCEVRGERARCVRDQAPNPCAAATCPFPSTCDVVDGEAVCTPIEEPPPASGPFCGGFAGIACPGQGTCADVPGDGCDPDNGGADCGGACECNVRALCIRGFAFDASPQVCACVPVEPPVDACAAVRCRAGTRCVADGDSASCIPDETLNPCAAVLCPAPSTCEVEDGAAVCKPIEPPAPKGPFCGGIAAFPCPGAGICADDPSDSCDPENGGADCGGVCACFVRQLCIQGLVFDPSPDVCACVADTSSGQECSAD